MEACQMGRYPIADIHLICFKLLKVIASNAYVYFLVLKDKCSSLYSDIWSYGTSVSFAFLDIS
jgi:hypothetical protein